MTRQEFEKTFTSIDDVRRWHRGHWFSPSTLRFFRSRVYEGVWLHPREQLVYFVSSEQRPGETRRYTVRLYDVKQDGIGTVGTLGQYATKRAATAAARRIAQEAACHHDN